MLGGYLPEKMSGQKTDDYIHLAHWYTTFCYLAGIDPTNEEAAKAKLSPIDSINIFWIVVHSVPLNCGILHSSITSDKVLPLSEWHKLCSLLAFILPYHLLEWPNSY